MTEGEPQQENKDEPKTPEQKLSLETMKHIDYTHTDGDALFTEGYGLKQQPENAVDKNEKRDWKQETDDYLAMCAECREKYPIEILFAADVAEPALLNLINTHGSISEAEKAAAVANLSLESKQLFIARTVGREELAIIDYKRKVISKETNIPREEIEKMRAEYVFLSQAIGVVNSFTGKIDHARETKE